jgi:hypothetical protein
VSTYEPPKPWDRPALPSLHITTPHNDQRKISFSTSHIESITETLRKMADVLLEAQAEYAIQLEAAAIATGGRVTKHGEIEVTQSRFDELLEQAPYPRNASGQNTVFGIPIIVVPDEPPC